MCFNGGWHRLSSMSQSLGFFSADMVMYVIVVHSIFFGQGKVSAQKFCVNSLDDNKNKNCRNKL